LKVKVEVEFYIKIRELMEIKVVVEKGSGWG
jgi:hypothetical protein